MGLCPGWPSAFGFIDKPRSAAILKRIKVFEMQPQQLRYCVRKSLEISFYFLIFPYFVILLFCYFVILLFCYFVILLFCYFANLLFRYFVTLLLCYSFLLCYLLLLCYFENCRVISPD